MTVTYRLNRITVTDFKILKTVEVDLSNTLTIIGGRNAQGKSSVIDALISSLAGAKHVPKVPIRKGSDKAIVVLKLDGPNGQINLTETFTASGRKLVITNADGFKSETPQSTLDKWFNASGAIDPLAFIRLDGKKQVEALKKALGLDFSKIDDVRANLYTERTGKNAVWQSLQKTYEQMERESRSEPVGTPDKEIDISALTQELTEVHEHNDRGSILKGDAERAAEKLRQADAWIENQVKEVSRLNAELADAAEKLALYQEKRGPIEASALELKGLSEAFEARDTEPLKIQIASADQINGFVRQKKLRDIHRDKFVEARKEADALTEQITALDAKKKELLASVKMPVEGLTFDETGLYLNELPIEQASSAEQLKVSIPISFASDSSLKFTVIRDGSLLDEESLRLVAELTETAGGQTIIERVTTCPAECSVILEDGEILESEVA